MLESAKAGVQAFPEDSCFLEHLHDAQAYYVNEKLESDLLDKLEKNKDWTGLQAVYLRLLGIFPESKKLHRLLDKVKRKIQASAENERKDFYQNAEKEIQSLIQKDQLDDAERACYEILSHDPERRAFIRLLAKVQHLIDNEIEEGLSLYYKTAIPALKADYKAHEEGYIRV